MKTLIQWTVIFQTTLKNTKYFLFEKIDSRRKSNNFPQIHILRVEQIQAIYRGNVFLISVLIKDLMKFNIIKKHSCRN
jgi:hypothetical protein